MTEVKKEKSNIFLWIMVATFVAIAAGAYYLRSTAEEYAHTFLMQTLSESGVEAELVVDSRGLFDWGIPKGSFKKDGYHFKIEGATLSLPYSLLWGNPDGTVLDVQKIEHSAEKKALFSPLRVKFALDEAEEDGFWLLSGMVGDQQEHWALHARLKMDIAATIAGSKEQKWRLDVNMPPVTFETGVLQPDQIIPALRGKLQQTNGTLAIEGHTTYEDEGVLTVIFQDFSTTAEDVPITELDGEIRFSSLSPVATAGEQTLRVKEILLGLPLQNGEVRFSLDGNILTLASSKWGWAGGELKTERMEIDVSKLDVDKIQLNAQNLLLEQLLSGLLEDGLDASGNLSGKLPVTFEAGQPIITGGFLTTKGGGTIRYIPTRESPLQKGSSMQTDLLLDAMQNFKYDVLTMKIDSLDKDTLQVKLRVNGRNPEVFDGQEIDLNVNLTGNLLDIARSGMNVYSLPERLEEQLVK